MSFILAIARNPVIAGLLTALLSMTVYAGAQKWRANGLYDDIHNPKTGYIAQVRSCEEAIEDQNAAMDLLAKDLEASKRRSEDAERINMERMNNAEARIDLGLAIPEATTCSGAISRLAKQIRGEKWER